MYNNKLKAIVLPVVIALAIVLGMGINSLLDHKEVPVNMGQRMIGSKLDYSEYDQLFLCGFGGYT